MLATSGTTTDLRGDDWLYELKWDGIRAIITGTDGKIRLMSRNGNDLTAAYPELTDRACWPDGDFVLMAKLWRSAKAHGLISGGCSFG